MPLWIMTGLASAAGLTAFALEESAPRVRRAQAAVG
jgi:hypothetical protein